MYSRLPITQTFSGNQKKFELSGVQVIGRSKQITRNKEISKWMGRECKYLTHFTSRAARDID